MNGVDFIGSTSKWATAAGRREPGMRIAAPKQNRSEFRVRLLRDEQDQTRRPANDSPPGYFEPKRPCIPAVHWMRSTVHCLSVHCRVNSGALVDNFCRLRGFSVAIDDSADLCACPGVASPRRRDPRTT
jgi:hypothetical protein